MSAKYQTSQLQLKLVKCWMLLKWNFELWTNETVGLGLFFSTRQCIAKWKELLKNMNGFCWEICNDSIFNKLGRIHHIRRSRDRIHRNRVHIHRIHRLPNGYVLIIKTISAQIFNKKKPLVKLPPPPRPPPLASSCSLGLITWFASVKTLIRSWAFFELLGVKKVYAVPVRWERPVRPIRWT